MNWSIEEARQLSEGLLAGVLDYRQWRVTAAITNMAWTTWFDFDLFQTNPRCRKSVGDPVTEIPACFIDPIHRRQLTARSPHLVLGGESCRRVMRLCARLGAYAGHHPAG